MRKKLLIGFTALAIVAIAALNLSLSTKINHLPDISLSEVEGDHSTYWTETSPVRLAPYSTSNIIKLGGAGFWSFHPIIYAK